MERNISFDCAGLNDVAVRLAWAQVEIFSDDVEKVQVLAAGDENSVKDLRIEAQNGELVVEQPQYGLSLNNITDSHWMQVCVRLPKSWDKQVHVSTIGGLLNARGLSGSKIELDTVSGDQKAVRLRTHELSMKSISGDLRADEAQASVIHARTVSGNVTLDSASADEYKCTTVSGEQKLALKQAFRQMELRSVSGDISLSLPCDKMNVSLRSVNGRVSANGVELVEAADVPQVRATSVSADLKIISVKE